MVNPTSPNFDASKCKKIRGTVNLYYDKKANDDFIFNDIKAKQYISINLDEDTKRKIDFKANTSYQIWKLLEDTYQKGKEERKLNLKKELDQMTHNKNDDIEMFISNMCNIFNKLKDLNEEVSNKLKFNYLYNSLSKEVAQETDIIMFQDKWDECLDHLPKTIPRLKLLKKTKIEKSKTNAYYSNETFVNKRFKNKNEKFNGNTPPNNRQATHKPQKVSKKIRI